MDPTIEADDIAVTYRTLGRRPVHALGGVALRARPGEIVGVLGPNGSGKSSLLGVLAGNIRPTRGSARVLGREPVDQALLPLVGYLPEGPLPFPWCTPRAFLQRIAALLGEPFGTSAPRVDAVLAQLGLDHVARRRSVGKLSTGMARRLGIAAALLPNPRILLLDEPTSGLDPEASLLVIDLLQQRAAAGGTILLASHHLQEVEQICSRVVMLRAGRIVTEGTLDELLGTGQTELVVEGLDRAGLDATRRTIAEHGGHLVREAGRRGHLLALFRRLRDEGLRDEGARAGS